MLQNNPHPTYQPVPAWAYIIIGILALVALWLCAPPVSGFVVAIFHSTEPTCTIGQPPTTITVRSQTANTDCQEMLNGPNNFTSVDWHKLGFMPYPISDSNSDGAIVCELDLDGRHITVRDSDPKYNVGGAVCLMLHAPLPK